MLGSVIGCEKDNGLDSEFIAKIVGFDVECSNCILSFPNDSHTISNEISESETGHYHAINLDRDTFRIGQQLSVNLRELLDQDLDAFCNPAYTYPMVYLTDWKPVE
jgi:hypothetical protein